MSFSFNNTQSSQSIRISDHRRRVSDNKKNLPKCNNASRTLTNASSTQNPLKPRSNPKKVHYSPEHYEQDSPTIPCLNDIDSELINDTLTPPGSPVRKYRKHQEMEPLEVALANQRDNTNPKGGMVGPFGRISHSYPSNRNSNQVNASRSNNHNPSILERTTLQPKTLLNFKKHNNKGEYGDPKKLSSNVLYSRSNHTSHLDSPKKIVPGSAIQRIKQEELELDDKIEEYDDSRNHYTSKDTSHWNTNNKISPTYGQYPRNRASMSETPTHETTKLSNYKPLVVYDEYGKTERKNRKRNGHHSDDDDAYVPSENEGKKNGKTSKSYGVNPQSFFSSEARRKSPRSLSDRSSKQNVIIELMDSEDDSVRVIPKQALQNTQESESSIPRMGETVKIDAVRIAIGSKVHHVRCKVSFQPGGKRQYIRLCYEQDKVNPPSIETSEHKIYLDDETSVTELKYFIADDDDLDENRASSDDAMIFLTMRISPNSSNKLDGLYTYLSDVQVEKEDETDKRRFVVIEFRNNDDLKKLLQSMTKNPTLANLLQKEDSKLTFFNFPRFSKALLKDNRRERSLRSRSLSAHDRTNILLLVYPFNGCDDKIEDAAKGLHEASIQIGKDIEIPAQTAADAEVCDSQEKSARAHYLTIRDEDRRRLVNDEFLNDTLVDFWMQWISRFQRKRTSLVHFFSSHFYTTLVNEGPNGVSSWTARKDINIFEKKFTFIPINESLHWSLCVVVNAGKIRRQVSDETTPGDNLKDEIPCLLFFDSLKAHKKYKVGKKVREWLNFECRRLGLVNDAIDEPFTDKTMILYDPKVPYQDNSWDCGVFVCRYAFGLLQAIAQPFTRDDAGDHFRSLITQSDSFKFSMEDIYRIRREMNKLILQLSEIFKTVAKPQANEKQANLQMEVESKATDPATSGE